MSRFTFAQQRRFEKLRMYLEDVAEQSLEASSCPLLDGQLNELLVLLERAGYIAEELRESIGEKP